MKFSYFSSDVNKYVKLNYFGSDVDLRFNFEIEVGKIRQTLMKIDFIKFRKVIIFLIFFLFINVIK